MYIKKTKCVGLLWFLLLVFSGITAEAQPNMKVEEDRIDEIFNEWARPGSPGCAVGVYANGEIIFSKGYGEAVLEDNILVTPQTVFYAGSVSKQFTAAAIALLSIRGEIELDRPVKDYIPGMSENAQYPNPVTVRQLVHHTSGLPDLYSLLGLYGIRLREVIPPGKLEEIVAGQSHLNFEPGSEYLYSNSGYTLMAELVKRVSGQTLREYTKENLFEPLGMHNTHFHDDRNHAIDHKALSYRSGNNEKFRLSYLSNFEGVGPGGLYTTVEDMIKWDQQLYENQLPNAEGFNELMHRRGILNNGDTLFYAFGLKTGEHKGQKTVGHNGSFMGFKADYLRLPEHQYGSVILCNLGDIDPIRLSKELADVFLKEPFKKWLSKYEGIYYSKALDIEYTLGVKDANLHLDRKTAPRGKLLYTGDHTFRTGGWEIVFKESDQGEVEGFIISSERAKNIFFKKRS